MREELRRLHELAGSPTGDRLKDHADRAGHSVSRSALAAVTTESDSVPRWATVEAFIDACARFAKAHKRSLPDYATDMLTWKDRYDQTYPRQRKDRSPNSGGGNELADPMASPGISGYDVRQDGLFPLGIWSPARKLDPSRLLTETVAAKNRPTQPYLDQESLAAAVADFSRTASGETVYLTGFRIDHRESDETQYCRVYQAPSTYPEVLAIEDLRVRRPELFEECDRALEQNVRGYLEMAVPSSLAVNLVVVSAENDELLCVERSAAVDSAVGWWTVGVFETMKQSDPNRPGSPEDLFSLAERGLNEELGLRPRDYNPIQITWIGILRCILRGHVVAVVKLRISKEELHTRVDQAHSGYEHAAVDWVPLRPSLVRAVNQATPTTHPGKVGFTIDVLGRTWIE
ncbi:hypothetical protein, partial [Amycolatopsis sp.]|uniref:hypothetical protein n=1 Tax=Amycolatopsis sp. TaxID=37632 RepID=UPI002D80AA88